MLGKSVLRCSVKISKKKTNNIQRYYIIILKELYRYVLF